MDRVGIGEEQPFAPGNPAPAAMALFFPVQPGRRRAGVHHANGRKRLRYFAGPVGRGVVHHDDFKVDSGLVGQ